MQIIGVILIIFVLLLYVLWLRWMKNQKPAKPQDNSGVQTFNITVKGVYSPGVLKAKAGKPIKINFTREESTECSRFVNFPDFKIRKELPRGETVSVDLIADKKGSFVFTCDMSMYFGKLIIE